MKLIVPGLWRGSELACGALRVTQGVAVEKRDRVVVDEDCERGREVAGRAWRGVQAGRAVREGLKRREDRRGDGVVHKEVVREVVFC